MAKHKTSDRAREALDKLMADPFLRRFQVMEALGVSSTTFYRMIEGGQFPPGTSPNGRSQFWRASTVRRYQTLLDLGALGPNWWQTRAGTDRLEPPKPPAPPAG